MHLSTLSEFANSELAVHMNQLKADIALISDKFGPDYNNLLHEVSKIIEKFENSVETREKNFEGRYHYDVGI